MTDSSTGGNSAATGNTEQQAPQRQLLLQKIYIKDLSFESPNSPQVFTGQAGDPQIQFNLKSSSRQVGEAAWEVLLTINVDAKGSEDRSLFMVELQQAGIFNIQGYSEEEMKPLIGSYCPSLLYPYAREAVSDMVSKGGFPQLLLQPINFDAVYLQSQRQAGQPSDATTAADPPAGNA